MGVIGHKFKVLIKPFDVEGQKIVLNFKVVIGLPWLIPKQTSSICCGSINGSSPCILINPSIFENLSNMDNIRSVPFKHLLFPKK